MSWRRSQWRDLDDVINGTPFEVGDRVVFLDGPDAGCRGDVVHVDWGDWVYVLKDGDLSSSFPFSHDLHYRHLRLLDVLEQLSEV